MSSNFPRKVIQILALAAGYFATARLGIHLSFPYTNIATLWPPSGIALAAIFLLGKWAWPGIFLGALMVNYSVGVSFFASAGSGLGNVLGALLGSGLLKGCKDFKPAFPRVKDVLNFALLAGLTSPLVNASVGTLSLWLDKQIESTQVPGVWLVWWSGDATGILIFGSIILIWFSSKFKKLNLRKAVEALLTLAAFTTTILFIFSSKKTLLFIPIPFIVFATLRFKQLGVAVLSMVLMTIAISQTVIGKGPASAISGSLTEVLSILHLYIWIASLTGLLLAAALHTVQESSRTIEDIIQSQPTGVYQLRVHSKPLTETEAILTYEFISRKYSELLGQSLAELRAHPRAIYKFIYPDDLKSFFTAVKNANTNLKSFMWEGRIVVKDTHRWLHFESKPRVLDDGDVLWTGSLLDITERKNEEALKDRTERYELVIAGSHAAIWDWDVVNGRMLFSPQWKAMRGYTDAEISDREAEWRNSIHPEDRDRVMAAIESHFTGKTTNFSSEYRILCKDGSSKWVIARGLALRDSSGTVIRMAGLETDDTERKRTEAALLAAKEAAESAAENKARFLDIAAHELRNPITAFSLLLQLAQKQIEKGLELNPALITRLRQPAERLTRLVIDLLDLSRFERGLTALHTECKNLVPLISNCVEEFKLQAPTRQLSLKQTTETIEVPVDSVRINQVLTNLLDNAVKYTPEDCPIEVAIEPLLDTVRVSVIDHGPGIPEDQLNKLFTPFTRGASDATVRAEGLGLGLSVSRGIVELHGGKIGVLSKLNQGSTFFFDLPRDSAIQNPPFKNRKAS